MVPDSWWAEEGSEEMYSASRWDIARTVYVIDARNLRYTDVPYQICNQFPQIEDAIFHTMNNG